MEKLEGEHLCLMWNQSFCPSLDVRQIQIGVTFAERHISQYDTRFYPILDSW